MTDTIPVATPQFRTVAPQFTVPENDRSRRVMERIGMAHEPADDFDHPNAPALRRRHVLYRIKSNELPNNRLQPTAAGAILRRRG